MIFNFVHLTELDLTKAHEDYVAQWAISIGHVDITYFMLKSHFFTEILVSILQKTITDEKNHEI